MLFRAWRYRQLCEQLAPVITGASLERVDKTLVDAYSKATAQGVTPEQFKATFNQGVIDKTHETLARENATRIRQWVEAILEEEDKATASGRYQLLIALYTAIPLLFLFCGLLFLLILFHR